MFDIDTQKVIKGDRNHIEVYEVNPKMIPYYRREKKGGEIAAATYIFRNMKFKSIM